MRFRSKWDKFDIGITCLVCVSGLGILFCCTDGGLVIGLFHIAVGVSIFLGRLLYLKRKEETAERNRLSKICLAVGCNKEESQAFLQKIREKNLCRELDWAVTQEQVVEVIDKVKPPKVAKKSAAQEYLHDICKY